MQLFLWGRKMMKKEKQMTQYLTLYSRSYCHLCDDMREALAPLLIDSGVMLRVVDVDDDPELIALYDELVPVLVGYSPQDGEQQLCHYFLDNQAVMHFLAKN
jgi:hypothetical protein